MGIRAVRRDAAVDKYGAELKVGRVANLWKTKREDQKPLQVIDDERSFGAGNEARTRDLNLGKVSLYQLSYSRPKQTRNCRAVPPGVKKNPVSNAAKAMNYPAIPIHDATGPACHIPPGSRLELSAAPQFQPRHAQVLDHGPEGEDRRHPAQGQPELEA